MVSNAKAADLGIEVGQVFLGKYRVDAILGQGGMGVVAACHHLQLDEKVAIKMLRSDVLTDQDAVQRFLREAQAAAKLKSEYVARVVDVGAFENGVPYMVMEFLDGFDLGQMLDEQKKLGISLTVDLILQACEALAEAHSLGIVHRDVKPTNLFVTWRADKPQLKVLDFGISKSAHAAEMKLTQTQSLLGTPAYMSPEQMRSAREVDARSDIWSLGTVMYEAIEGRPPFEAESFSEMCVKVAMDPPAPMRIAPPQLQQAILHCLAKAPEQRFGNMAELARELIPFASDPHQANTLVERMQRMLRRSHVDFDTVTGTGGANRVPNAIRDIGSAPATSQSAVVSAVAHQPSGSIRAMSAQMANAQPQWAGGSTPSGTPLAADGSSPFVKQRAPSTQLVAATKAGGNRALIAVIALAVILGVGGAIMYAGSKKDSTATTKPPTVEIEHDREVTPTDKPVKDVVKDPAKDQVVKEAITPPTPPVPPVDDVKKGSDAVEEIEMPVNNPPKNPPQQVQTQIKKPPPQQTGKGNAGTGVVKANGSDSKTVVTPPPPPAGKGDTTHCADGSLILDHQYGCGK